MSALNRTVATGLVTILILVLTVVACSPSAPPATKEPSAAPTAAPTKESKPAPAATTAPTAAPTGTPTKAPPGTPTASASKPALAPLSPRVSVKLGSSRVSSDAGYYMAMEKGYFDKQGLDIELVPFSGARDMAVALAAGQVDIASGSPGAGFFNAIQRDVPLKVVADKGSVPPGRGFNAIIVRKDLWDSGQFKDFPDLKGKTIAMQPNSEVLEILMSRLLEKAKLQPSDVRVEGLGFPEVTAALANKGIDLGVQIEPFVAEGVAKGIFVRWKGVDEISPNGQYSVVVYSAPFIKNKAEAAKRFMVAYVQGLRDYNLAYDKNIGKQEFFAALAKYSTVKDTAIMEKMVPAGLNPDGYVSAESINEILQWSKKKGILNREIAFDEVVDNQYVDFANQVLGKYQR